MNDANTLEAPAYTVTNISAGYKRVFWQQVESFVQVGIQNAFDTKYASAILINARSFGNNEARFFYPGQGRNFFVRVAIKCNF